QVRRDDGRPPHLVAVVDQQVEFGQPASVLVGVLASQVIDGESVDLASFVPNRLTSGPMESRGKMPCLQESSLRRVELNVGYPCLVPRINQAILPGATASAAITEAARPRRHAKHRQAPCSRGCLAGPLAAEQQQDSAG